MSVSTPPEREPRLVSFETAAHNPVSAVVVVLLVAIALTVGCSPSFYRRQADAEVDCIVDNKSVAVGLPPGSFRIDVDPRSRMYDPSNPDCPPMPPDDPISHELMICVDCKAGSPCWRHAKKTPYAQNPTWEDYLPRDEEGNIVLDLPGAVQLALLESPNYQEQLENLYLAGLDVTFERFRFDTQFFGGSSIFFTADGRDRSGTGNSSSLLEVAPLRPANRLRAEKLTATGGELVVGLANSLMWQVAGPDDYSSNTLLDFSIVQPLLRAGGRTRILERLTIAERALLASVRQMERYREGFYLNVVTGEDPGDGPSRRGGFFGGSGLEGFSGVGGGGFGRVGGFEGGFFGAGFGFTGGAGAGVAGGYLGLLQTAQVLRNQYANIAELRDSLAQLQAAYDAGRIDRFQVDLARQALYNSQSQLLNSAAQYESSLDDFKIQHGLPPNLPVVVSDPLLDRFNLLEPTLTALQNQVGDLLDLLRGGEQEDSDLVDELQVEEFALPLILPPDEEPKLPKGQGVEALLAASQQLKEDAQRHVAMVQEDVRRLEDTLPRRRAALERLSVREEAQKLKVDPELLAPDRLIDRFRSLQKDLSNVEKRLAEIWARLDELVASNQHGDEEELRTKLTGAMTALSGNLLELSLIQARARLDTVTFDPVELKPEEAYCIASHYRLDWMNARAALVDAWRLIFFNANDLEAFVNVLFSGDLGNVGDNPFRLRSTNGRLRVGLEFDAPLTRLAERNVYRQSLIEYQQARRNYYQFCDRVYRDLRGTLRQLEVDELNFELRRAAVHVAITQVDLARLRLSEPARPVAATQPGQVTAPGGGAQFGDTVARDLVNALIDLLNVQNDFLSVWVDHEVQRLNLDFDLGVMELDSRGLRIEHDQPIRTYLENLPPTVPWELPNPCADVSKAMPAKQSFELRQPEHVSPPTVERLPPPSQDGQTSP